MSVDLKPRKIGRPATGKDAHIAARFPDHLLTTIEDWAERNDLSRSEALRRLVELGLDFSTYVNANAA